MNSEEISRSYADNEKIYKELKEEIIFEITSVLDEASIKYHSVTARIKALSSLLKKAESKDIRDPLDALPDIVGARIVTLFLSDINKIVDILEKVFDVCLVDNKIDDNDPRIFGYLSLHLHAKIKSSNSGRRYDRLKPLLFEVQVRTIAMDAWASASHYLAYKSEEDVPIDLRRDFNALSGLYYVADKHFEMFFRSRAANLKRMDRAFETHQLSPDQTLDLDTLIAFLKSRYRDRNQGSSEGTAELLRELRIKGLTTVAALNAALDATQERFLERERTKPPDSKLIGDWLPNEVRRFSSIGVVRGSMAYL